MKQPYEVIRDLQATSSRLDKEAILRREAQAENSEFFAGLRLALDPLMPFNVKKIPPKFQDTPNNSLPYSQFYKLCLDLTERHVTGNAALDMIHDHMVIAGYEEWNEWYLPILLKDLKAGISEKTVNKVLKAEGLHEWCAPVFGGCQLAHDGEKNPKRMVGLKQVEVKLDGVRALVFVRNTPAGVTVDIFSRNGKKFLNFGHIEDQIIEAHEQLGEPGKDYVVDGEIMSSSFQDLMKQVYRKSDVQAQDAVLHAFDIITADQWLANHSNKKQCLRTSTLETWYDHHRDYLHNVSILDHELINLDTNEGSERLKVLNRYALDHGYEGLILKDPSAGYENGRSHAWMKLKPFIEVSLTVESVVEGEGRNQGRLGAFECSGVDDGVTIRTHVGSGFSDVQREQYYTSEVVGSVVEVRADAVTMNQDGTYSLRFPRFLRFRGFGAGDKV